MSALEKRVKRHVHGVPHQALVRFPKGFGDVCLAEVQETIPTATLEENAVVLKEVAFRDLISLPLRLTTAREILWQIAAGKAETIKQVKARVAETDWDLILPEKSAISLRVASTMSRLFHEGKVEELVSKELEILGFKVSKDKDHLLDVRLLEDYLTLSLSLSGRPLFQRGYKSELKGTASVKEDIAAAATRVAFAFGGAFRPDRVIVPFAGSGTLGFEAALFLGKVPPAKFGAGLSLDAWVCTPKATLAHAKKKLIEGVQPVPPVTFVEIEKDQAATLERNWRSSGFAGEVLCRDALKTPIAGNSFIPINPPYGERLGAKSATSDLYRRIAQWLLSAKGEVLGFVFAPTEAVAEAFVRALAGWRTETRAFNHGGRNTYQVSFAKILRFAQDDS